MKKEYIEKIYAGWLAKVIGIRLGAPVEGWTYDRIRTVLEEIDGYPVDYREFAADDDSNGPLFYLRALEDGRKEGVRNGEKRPLQSKDVAQALLNYAPFEHGFFWWGGYGVSTEHTAYLNLYHGVQAPESGSMALNGSTVAEQIGGQIFIDTWGLVAPGNPRLAARLAREAAAVTHDGNGVYGGIFIAACISAAFEETDIRTIIGTGLSFLPKDCEYTRVVRAVMDWHEAHPEDWRACYGYIHENFGYDRYPGGCHIIPNIAVMILALLYGNGDFSDTLNICCMCGWDTDCNVGNVATIMGVRGGLEAIDYEKWRAPVHDFLVCSSVVGSLNIMDIPFGASYIGRLACEMAGEEPPEPWKELWEQRPDSCHFEFPGSTHSLRMKVGNTVQNTWEERECSLRNSDKAAHTGSRSLHFAARPINDGERVMVYKKTYYRPADFHDSRYDPAFSPLIYPGDVLHAAVCIPKEESGTKACLYVHGGNSGTYYYGEEYVPEGEKWLELTWKIPVMHGELLDEAGVCFLTGEGNVFSGFLDDLYWDREPEYEIDFSRERIEVWPDPHREVSQFTRWKGMMYLGNGQLQLSCSDEGEGYTGDWCWTDYEAEFAMTVHAGRYALALFRVQGAQRCYAFGFLPGGEAALLKKEEGKYRILCRTEYAWELGKEYLIQIRAEGGRIGAGLKRADGTGTGDTLLEAVDGDMPWLHGMIGVGVREGSHCSCREIRVKKLG